MPTSRSWSARDTSPSATPRTPDSTEGIRDASNSATRAQARQSFRAGAYRGRPRPRRSAPGRRSGWEGPRPSCPARSVSARVSLRSEGRCPRSVGAGLSTLLSPARGPGSSVSATFERVRSEWHARFPLSCDLSDTSPPARRPSAASASFVSDLRASRTGVPVRRSARPSSSLERHSPAAETARRNSLVRRWGAPASSDVNSPAVTR